MMFAPADLFTPFVNAIALALKRAITFVSEHLIGALIIFAIVVLIVVVIGRARR